MLKEIIQRSKYIFADLLAAVIYGIILYFVFKWLSGYSLLHVYFGNLALMILFFAIEEYSIRMFESEKNLEKNLKKLLERKNGEKLYRTFQKGVPNNISFKTMLYLFYVFILIFSQIIDTYPTLVSADIGNFILSNSSSILLLIALDMLSGQVSKERERMKKLSTNLEKAFTENQASVESLKTPHGWTDVVFSDSEKGSMCAAKNFKDVLCIGTNFDIGDISGELDSKERKNECLRVFSSVKFESAEVDQYFRTQRDDYEKLFAVAKSGAGIRIWKSDAPFSACAFSFLCDALLDIECHLSIVELPEYWEMDDGAMQSCADWSELSPDQFHRFISLEREVSTIEKREQSNLWRTLKAENAPLRALVNGKLISVPEDFYDLVIIKHIPNGEFVMAHLIGIVLSEEFGIGDGWIALRIRKMIADNKLRVVADSDPSHPYGKILKRN